MTNQATRKAIILVTVLITVVIGIIFAVICFISRNSVDKKENVFKNTTTATYSDATQKEAVKPSEYTTEDMVQTATEITTEPETVPITESSTMQVIEVTTETFTTAMVSTLPPELKTEPQTQENVSNPTEPSETDTLPTEIPTEMPTEPDGNLFEKLLARSGYTLSELENNNIHQLIIADTYGTQSEIHLFTQKDDVWENENISCYGFIGSNGSGERSPFDNRTTPKGLFKIGDCFYQNEQPVTWLNTFRITENTCWVEDTQSEWYNQKVEIENKEDMPKSKIMSEEDCFEYSIVIEYNTNPIDKEKGTAVFMCCGHEETTDGNIAVAQNDLLQYLNLLNAAKNPHIIIF